MSEQPTPDPADLLQLARTDLAAYVAAFQPDFQLAPHVEMIVSALERVERGDLKRLLISMPPRHGKSLIASTYFPAWALGRKPRREIIAATYAQDFAEDWGRKVRNQLADPVFRAIFQACRSSDDSAAAHRFTTTAGGAYYAIGRGGQATGRGADLLLVDDALKDAIEARSPTIRHQLHEWYATTAYTRLSPGAAVVIVATRWHEADLTGWLLEEHADEGWEVLSLPAIAEENDPLGRAEGAALWPERFPLPALEAIRRQLGGAAFTALYQQRPAALEGQIFKRSWWRTYRDVPAAFDKIVLSADTAFKSTETADYSALTVWGETKTGYYLLHAWRGRVEFPELKRIVVSLAAQWKPNAVLVEDRASGQSLIQELQSGTSLPVLPVSADRDKVTRASAITPMIEAGRVFLPESAPWLDEYLDELSTFPAATHDDWTDSTTQALNYLRGPGQDGLLGYYERQNESARRADLEAYWRPRTTSPEALEAAIAKALTDDVAREEWDKKQRDEQAQAEREQGLRAAGLSR